MSNDSETVRWHVARALGELGGEAALAAGPLRDALDGAGPALQTHVAIALGRIGDNSAQTVEALMQLVASNDGSVARSAIAALRKLDVDAKTVVDALDDVHPDDLTPKAALDLIYRLKDMSRAKA